MTIDKRGPKAATFAHTIVEDHFAALFAGLAKPLDAVVVNEGHARMSACLVEAREARTLGPMGSKGH